ncbi:MAG: cobalt-precorrin-7 (C(5))-methyltransferase [Planctomycetota bacterium]|jgi:precorrin-6y C5,15-methyltransferase (decarboxylating) CbiE subunit
MNKINIIGCGPGNKDYVSEEAKQKFAESNFILGSERLVSLFDSKRDFIKISYKPEEACRQIEKYLESGSVGVLVTGDPTIFSLGNSILDHFGSEKCCVVKGTSSVEIACERTCTDFCGIEIVSAHGRIPEISNDIFAEKESIAVLCGTKEGEEWVKSYLEQYSQNYDLWYCADLTLESEIVKKIKVEDLGIGKIKSRVIIVLKKRHKN